MAAVATLEEFLKQKREEGKPTEGIDWDARKKQWLDAVFLLFNTIEGWLKPLEALGPLRVTWKEVELSEEYIGEYKAPSIVLTFGDSPIFLRPRGTLIVGSYGRVDITGKNGVVMLVMPDWGKWTFFSRGEHGGIKNTYELLTEESFKDVLLSLVSD